MPEVEPAPSLTPRLVAIVILGVAFIALTLAITGGLFNALDAQVAQVMHATQQPALHGLFQAVAELGGIELTSVLMLALAVYVWRSGFGSDALVFGAFVAAEAFEVFYKLNLYHPGPPRPLMETDGPSVTMLLHGGPLVAANSFPSGHVMRAVIVYGLLAFVGRRLSTSPWVQLLAVPLAVLAVVVVSFDRLYLDVHWESDVVGGLLLGAIALLAGTVWLDRPRQA